MTTDTNPLNPLYPEVTATLSDGNVFAVIGAVRRALRRAGESEAAAEWVEKATSCGSYDEVLGLAMATVQIELA